MGNLCRGNKITSLDRKFLYIIFITLLRAPLDEKQRGPTPKTEAAVLIIFLQTVEPISYKSKLKQQWRTILGASR